MVQTLHRTAVPPGFRDWPQLSWPRRSAESTGCVHSAGRGIEGAGDPAQHRRETRWPHVSAWDFFLSSRRRHTRCSRDWSSDVCSSDLKTMIPSQMPAGYYTQFKQACLEDLPPGMRPANGDKDIMSWSFVLGTTDKVNPRKDNMVRSEERRVGKERRDRRAAAQRRRQER